MKSKAGSEEPTSGEYRTCHKGVCQEVGEVQVCDFGAKGVNLIGG
jgi:hypothetical protein